MGITYVTDTVRRPTGEEPGVSFLVDSGATYTFLPKPVWEAVELDSSSTPSAVPRSPCGCRWPEVVARER
jgi:predicted aspartyl protease